ncbi:MAG: hypothetical protein J0L97_10250, partial [Alphaproteobacteria bacterium]|nr:hypothetical protein [Alphaproteobacteria bacterium]
TGAGPFRCSIVSCGSARSADNESTTEQQQGQNPDIANCQNMNDSEGANNVAIENTSYRCGFADVDAMASRRVMFDLFALATMFFIMMAFASTIPEMSKRLVSLFDVGYLESANKQINKIPGVGTLKKLASEGKK